MPSVHRFALVPYTPDQMFDLVRDVRSYPRFLGWVRGAEVLEDEQTRQRATLEVQLGGLVRRFTTCNLLVPGEKLVMRLERGPFEELGGEWNFRPVGAGCRVSLDLHFRMAGSLFLLPFQRRFSQMADRLVDDFTQRARQVHGR